MQVAYLKFNFNRNFGIELEASRNISPSDVKQCIEKHTDREVVMSGWSQTRDNNYWHIKEDSTCGEEAHKGRDYGIEVASFKASGIKQLLEIGKVAKELKKIGLKTNPNCGFHIHVEIADFTPEQVAVLMAWWIKIEPYICQMVLPYRLKSKHCKLWYKSKKYKKNEKYQPDEFWKKIKPTNLAVHNNSSKKVSLNLVNYATGIENSSYTRKTIELRLPEGTLSSKEIVNWTRLLVNFVENVKNFKMPSNQKYVKNVNEFLEVLGLNYNENTFFIYSSGLYTNRLWILNKMINSSVENPFTKDKIDFKKEAQEKLNFVVFPY